MPLFFLFFLRCQHTRQHPDALFLSEEGKGAEVYIRAVHTHPEQQPAAAAAAAAAVAADDGASKTSAKEIM